MSLSRAGRLAAAKKGLLLSVCWGLLVAAWPGWAGAEVCNLKLVTDGNPDYSDIGSMIYSITSRWEQPKDKCWALWYWNHIARRQTAPDAPARPRADRSDPAVQRLRLHHVQHGGRESTARSGARWA